jgi:DnaJ-class molecular chaperone
MTQSQSQSQTQGQQPGSSSKMNPGDEAPPGTKGTGEAPCHLCGGTGRLQGQPCPECGGTGKVTQGVGGA